MRRERAILDFRFPICDLQNASERRRNLAVSIQACLLPDLFRSRVLQKGSWLASFIGLAVACIAVPALIGAPAVDGPAFFESRVRPLLIDHCYSCHSAQAQKVKAGLRVDSLEGLLRGGEHGPAVVPGDPDKSLLLQAVRATDPDQQMPPKGPRLSARQIADLVTWVQLGAPWGKPLPSGPAGASAERRSKEITSEDKAWWSFKPIQRPPVPTSTGKGATSTSVQPIDAFVQETLTAKGLKANPRATRRELIRRAYFDLIGLPPTPEEIAAFERDTSADAWSRLIDQLLARPQYGERWGRHWLDVARFAQSNGYERDGEKPLAWRYRDYVVRAFNDDKRYDQFIKEQIAGDELDPVTTDGLIATGFQRLGVWDDEPDDKRMAEFDELDDVLSTTGGAFLGVTLGCARCHDHKFDPIPQADYYRLLAFFRNIRLNEAAKYNLESGNYLPLAEPAKVAAWQESQRAKLEPLQKRLAGVTNAGEKAQLTREIDGIKNVAPPFAWALGVRERGRQPPPTHVLVRGNAGSPGQEVQPAFLSVVGGAGPALPAPGPEQATVGRRRALANWIASSDNPLTARVLVNRVWHHHFGRGIVKTTSDFGRAGTLPTHPALLDWLAAEFMAKGWSIKQLHRTILLSETYQRSSRTDNARAAAADPGNDLLWRQNLRRLDAEALRDTLLAISGRLNPTMGGRGFFPRLSGEVLAGQSRPGLDWEISSPEERARRSLYAYVRRTMMVPMFDAFDYNNTTSPLNERPVTTVSSQSLLLLNDEFLQEQAAAFADRIVRDVGVASASRPEALIRRGFELAVGREPTRQETRVAREFLQRQESAFAMLRTRLTFRPDVPTSLSGGYLDLLPIERFLVGPTEDWAYHRGRWSGGYEGIRTVDRDRGPFALAAAPVFSNGTIEARVTLHVACESAGVLVRAQARDHQAIGYEIAFEPREQRLQLRRHDGDVTLLADAPAMLPVGKSFAVKIDCRDARLRIWIDGTADPAIDRIDPRPISVGGGGGGRVGVRAWGAPVSLDDLIVTGDGQAPVKLVDRHLAAPEVRARQALGLLLLNLNEVVYVD